MSTKRTRVFVVEALLDKEWVASLANRCTAKVRQNESKYLRELIPQELREKHSYKFTDPRHTGYYTTFAYEKPYEALELIHFFRTLDFDNHCKPKRWRVLEVESILMEETYEEVPG
jgi:hypothetical protein